jgi:hypothetical protein
MSPENFIYWLQGYFEISGVTKLNESQVKIIKDHLKLVFDKKTPDREYFKTEKFCNPSPFISPAGPYVDLSKGPVCTSTGSTINIELPEGISPLTFDQGVSHLTTDGGVSPLTTDGGASPLTFNIPKGLKSKKND